MGSHSARKVNKEDFMKLQTAKTMLQYAKQYMDLGQLRVVQTDEDWVYIPSHKAIGVAEYTPQDEIEWEEWMIGYIKDTFDYDAAIYCGNCDNKIFRDFISCPYCEKRIDWSDWEKICKEDTVDEQKRSI
jgi:hypothetical protein